jgi:type I restriction enzyme S subunit
MKFNEPIGGLIDFAIGGGWGSEVPKENHSRVAVIRGTDIPKVASGDFSTVPFRYESDKKILNRTLAPGDVVLETAGGSSANGQYTGRTLLITQEILDVLGPTICASFCKKLVLNKDLVNPSYFYLYMQDLYKSGRVASYDSQSTGISNFQYEAFVKNELIELPKLEIQTSVASALSNLQSKINNNSQISKTLEDIAQTIFKSWFIDFDPVKAKMAGERPMGMDSVTASLFPNSMAESELGVIPQGWEWKTIGDIAHVIDCLHSKKPQLLSEGYPYLQLDTISDSGVLYFENAGRISKEDYEKWTSRIEVEGGDCLITNVGRVGAVSQVPRHFKAAIGRNITAIRPKNSKLNQSFLIVALLSDFMKREISKNTDSGTILEALNVKNIPKLLIPGPSTELLLEFAKVCDPIQSQIQELQAMNVNLRKIRNSLLPRLISGELQIPEEMLAS